MCLRYGITKEGGNCLLKGEEPTKQLNMYQDIYQKDAILLISTHQANRLMNLLIQAKHFFSIFTLQKTYVVPAQLSPSCPISRGPESMQQIQKSIQTHLATATTPTSFGLTHDPPPVRIPLTATRIYHAKKNCYTNLHTLPP